MATRTRRVPAAVPSRRSGDVSGESIDLAKIRSSLAINCATFAVDPAASARAMDLMLTLRRTATAFQTMAESYTRAYGLSPAKVVIVMALAATEAHTLAQAVIGRELSVSLGNLTALIASLEKAGLVRRRTDRSDGRVTLVSLTPAGLELVDRFAPDHYRIVAAAVDGLTAAEQRTMIRLLDKMRDQLKMRDLVQPATSPRAKRSS
jgi:DNA-binding MarR family transcriptional regulator